MNQSIVNNCDEVPAGTGAGNQDSEASQLERLRAQIARSEPERENAQRRLQEMQERVRQLLTENAVQS